MFEKNRRIEALQEIANRFPNTFEAIAFLNDPNPNMGGEIPSNLILDNDFNTFYSGLDKDEF